MLKLGTPPSPLTVRPKLKKGRKYNTLLKPKVGCDYVFMHFMNYIHLHVLEREDMHIIFFLQT